MGSSIDGRMFTYMYFIVSGSSNINLNLESTRIVRPASYAAHISDAQVANNYLSLFAVGSNNDNNIIGGGTTTRHYLVRNTPESAVMEAPTVVNPVLSDFTVKVSNQN